MESWHCLGRSRPSFFFCTLKFEISQGPERVRKGWAHAFCTGGLGSIPAPPAIPPALPGSNPKTGSCLRPPLSVASFNLKRIIFTTAWCEIHFSYYFSFKRKGKEVIRNVCPYHLFEVAQRKTNNSPFSLLQTVTENTGSKSAAIGLLQKILD